MVQTRIMDAIELFPSISHCIETTAREEFWNAANQYMKSGEQDRALEDRIKLLKAFLESADFKKLRSQSEKHLVERKKVKFVVAWQKGKSNCEMVITEE